jgi:NTE family protein
MAMEARLGTTAEERKAVIRARLPSTEWPTSFDLRITAVDAGTGDLRVFDAASGVDLVEAVAASCAVPLVWPPVPIDGRHYIDGGMRSAANVDLAADVERVVVLAPLAGAARRSDRPARQLAALGPMVRGTVISPSDEARSAIGRNPLDPARRAPSAEAGLAQSALVADAVAAVWS